MARFTDISPRFSFVLIMICFCCSQKQNKKEISTSSIIDSLAQSDLTPIKTMADTILLSVHHPLTITTRENSDSVHIFPYSLIFEEKNYDAFVVSFNDFSPTLITLDQEAHIIDSMTLIGTIRKEDGTYRDVKHVKIISPSVIISSDSIFTWDVDLKNQRDERSETLYVTVTHYGIGEDGRIVKRKIDKNTPRGKVFN